MPGHPAEAGAVLSRTPDRVFVALADPTRRQLLDELGRRGATSASALARELPVTRQAIGKHLEVLAEVGLVTNSREGREVLFRVRGQPLRDTAAWLEQLASSWDAKLADLKHRAERNARPARRSGQ